MGKIYNFKCQEKLHSDSVVHPKSLLLLLPEKEVLLKRSPKVSRSLAVILPHAEERQVLLRITREKLLNHLLKKRLREESVLQ